MALELSIESLPDKHPRDEESLLTTPTSTRARLLADIRELAPDITARAAEIEAGRRVPVDLVTRLKSIGVFRMFVPQSHGGLEVDLPSALEIIAALSRIDGSVGWTVAIGNGSGIFASLLPAETYERVYRDGPDVTLGGSVTPAGTADRTAGGWRVSGRWPFVSGCLHADWLAGLCVMRQNGAPIAGADGPLVRGFFLPVRHWTIEDTWHAAGLKGTGSHHIGLTDVAVSEANFFDFPNGVSCLPGPLYQALPHLLPLIHSAFAVGMAEGALDEIVALANTGRQQLRAAGAHARVGGVPMGTRPRRRRRAGGAGVPASPGRIALVPRRCRNAQQRGAPGPGHAERDMDRHRLRPCRRRILRARRRQRGL
jgi:alkylation response protein AidB-like acyl-CoA dehydrogenase